MSLRRKIAAFAIANLLAMPLMSAGLANAQSVLTNQDRTVVTLDVPAPSCTSVIDDVTLTNTGAVWNGSDLGAHDEDDSAASGNSAVIGGGDGFDQVLPSPANDFSDSEFSDLTRNTMDASMRNITVDDPDEAVTYGFETDLLETDGSGYVDLQEVDQPTNTYAAEFIDLIDCSVSSGYDLHIADTFNIEPSFGLNLVSWDDYDIALTGTGATNLNKREGLFRIAPDSLRDITNADLAPGNETESIKHEYVMDLPSYACIDDGSLTPDDWANDCVSAQLDPYAADGLRTWPYDYTLTPSNHFGTVGFTLLCAQDHSFNGTATMGTGRINPWSRGISNPLDPLVANSEGYPNTYAAEITPSGVDDCDDLKDKFNLITQYAAIPSLIDGLDYDGIAGSDYTTYGAILGANNWVGYSGFINPPLPSFSGTPAQNFFEVRANVPDNQTAGTYAGTIILSCLPNMTAEPEFDLDGDFTSDDLTVGQMNFFVPTANVNGIVSDYTTNTYTALEDSFWAANPLNLTVTLSAVPATYGTASYAHGINDTALQLDGDHDLKDGSFTIVPGQVTYTIPVNIADNIDTPEVNEYFTFQLTSISIPNYTVGQKDTVTVNLDKDD